MRNTAVYYEYQPLLPGHIRLLHLKQPSLASPDQIELTLEHVDLATKPAFNALSYTWGPPTLAVDREHLVFSQEPRCYPFRCNGRLVRGTQNLRDALLQLLEAQFHPDQAAFAKTKGINTSLPIWIDALCINQDDMTERESQVKLMVSIYRSAASVIAWLGHADKFSEVALPMIVEFARPERQALPDYQERESITAYQNQKTSVLSGYTETDLAMLGIFFKRHWFSRTWILQEASVNTNVRLFCGSDIIEWDGVAAAALYLVRCDIDSTIETFAANYASGDPELKQFLHTPAFVGANLSRPYQIATLWSIAQEIRTGQFVDFHHTSRLSFNTQCSDPRDKVYAIMGLSPDSPTTIEPNYNIDVAKLYVKAWHTAIQGSRNLEPLRTFQNPEKTIKFPGLPSWCPDLTQKISPAALITYGNPNSWCAGQRLSSSPLTAQLSDHSLLVKGVRLSVVAAHAPLSVSQPRLPQDCVDVMCVAAELPQTQGAKRSNEKPKFERLWRTLIADTIYATAAVGPEVGRGAALYFESLLAGSLSNQAFGFKPVDVVKDFDATTRYFKRRCDLLGSRPSTLIPLSAVDDNDDDDNNKNSGASISDTGAYFFLSDYNLANKAATKRDPQAELGHAETWLTMGRRLWWGRALVRTVDGRLGLVADCVRDGDEVWLLAGLDAPCVLRRLVGGNRRSGGGGTTAPAAGDRGHVDGEDQGEGGGRFLYLGDAYIEGAMFGEAVPENPVLEDVELV